MSNPFKKRHTKSNGCDLILSYCLLRYVVIEQQQWVSIGHSMKILYLSRIQFNLLLLQDRISLGLSLYSFHTTVFLVVGLSLLFWKTFLLFFICMWDMCIHTHFSMLALTFLTPFGWLNTVLVSACRQYVNTRITLDQSLVE